MAAKPRSVSTERDARVLELYEQLLEIEQRLIPTGLHVFGRPGSMHERTDLLKTVASFDRAEVGTRALTDLIAEGLGFGSYARRIGQTSLTEQQLTEREHVDQLAGDAVRIFVDQNSEAAAAFLSEQAAVPTEQSLSVFQFLEQISRELKVNHEFEALGRALRGEYIEPGPGAD